jgi:hypothetical protein
MKKTILTLSLILFGIVVFAQAPADTSYWKRGGIGTLTFTQLSFYQWAAGGENSYTETALLNLFANYKKGSTSWDNTLDLGYGIIKQGDLTKKSNDRIDFSSQFGKKASGKWNYSTLLAFKTQFAPGYNYPDDSTIIANFFSPAYITLSIGMDYKPNEHFSLFLSPVTGKMTLVIDDSLSAKGAYGVDPGKKMRLEFGGFLKASYKLTVMKNVDLATKIDLFSNYLNNPQNIDVNWELMISMKVNEYLSATFNTLVLYDDDIDVPRKDKLPGPGVQVKELFGIGLSYKF